MEGQHMSVLIEPEEIDRRLSWMPGRAAKLARRRLLPHILLPDGSIRFDWEEIEKLLCRVDAVAVPAPSCAFPA
jgi:hypothetical protein